MEAERVLVIGNLLQRDRALALGQTELEVLAVRVDADLAQEVEGRVGPEPASARRRRSGQ